LPGADVTRRYREQIEVETHPASGVGSPGVFRWRGRTYHVLAVLGHWREDAGYWTSADISVPQRDAWRVEASDGIGIGVFELVNEAGGWLLDRVWD
jgi:hypothetical protein